MRVLTAAEGKVYSNGESYGRTIYLSDLDSPVNRAEMAEETSAMEGGEAA